ncbi:MAG: hypothetical protein ACWA5R_04720 [bacterium]
MINTRFTELASLLDAFIKECYYECDKVSLISSQLENVLKNCDSISYDEPGAAQAYAILHFLDRFHRFQLTFKELDQQKIMPIRNRKIDILDIGTGPGPSMFALSDFYTEKQKELRGKLEIDFNIDYVERSDSFRSWIHHFTEYANYHSPSKMAWKVPYHHGTFFDFKDIEFNQYRNDLRYNRHGQSYYKDYVKRYRFDIAVFSNFLTNKSQVMNFSDEIVNSMRFLRNNGVFIIVGSKSTSKKYREVYDELSKILLNENFNNWKFIAGCKKKEMALNTLCYSWNDEYGKQLKLLTNNFYRKAMSCGNDIISPEIRKILENTISSSYNRTIEWEIHVFTKYAKLRKN